ncbi:MAG: bifunctional metallophosphatase/5'-nucleotidase [Caldilineaceae bacterium]|nr:bifunctional metallophosphatase/5'-nucleotidase [Caldilineaceae bacterium]
MGRPPANMLYLVQSAFRPSGDPYGRVYLLRGDVISAPVGALGFAGARLAQPAQRSAERATTLHLYHFNDLHGNLALFSDQAIQPVFAQLAGYYRRERDRRLSDRSAATLLLAAGDDLAGSRVADLAGIDPQGHTQHPTYAAYSAAGVDAVTLGNHDLDKGPEYLAVAIRNKARFPVLAANLLPPPELRYDIHAGALFMIKGLRVAVIGLTTPARPQRGAAGWQVADPVRTLEHMLPVLRPQCDVVIVLSHLGRSLTGNRGPVSTAGDIELAEHLAADSVHVVVGGHTHDVLNEDGLAVENVVNGTAVVQAGAEGRYLGQVIIHANSHTTVADARLLETARLPKDEMFERRHILPHIQRLQAALARPLGTVEDSSALATTTVRGSLCTGESPLANFVSDALVARCHVYDLTVDGSLVDATVIRAGLQPGARLTLGDWYQVMPAAATVRIVELTGHDLLMLLHDNALRIDRPGEPHVERGFVHFSRSLRYAIDLGTERRLAVALHASLNGESLWTLRERRLRLAYPSTIRSLAVAWENHVRARQQVVPLSLSQWTCWETGLDLRRELVAFIEEHGGVTAAAGARCDGRLVVAPATPPMHGCGVRESEYRVTVNSSR